MPSLRELADFTPPLPGGSLRLHRIGDESKPQCSPIHESGTAPDIFRRGIEEPSSLSTPEAIRYAFLLRSYANQWLEVWRLQQPARLPRSEGSWDGLLNRLRFRGR